MDRINLHLYGGAFKNTSRILKESKSIIKFGLSSKVIITAVSTKLQCRRISIDKSRLVDEVSLFSARLPKSLLSDLLKYFEYLVKVFFKFRIMRIDVINAHSLNVLLVGVLLKKYGNSIRLIYDPHELETERVGLLGVPQKISKWVERFLIRHVDHVIVVCNPIRDWYQNEYGIDSISVVRNIPTKYHISGKNNILRDAHDIPYEDIVFIYQGVLSKARGIYEMLEAFKSVSPDRHIVFMGYGPAQEDIVAASKKYLNIHFQQAVAPQDIVIYASGADVGLNFISGELCKSYQLSLPNKFFEYLYAGCCVLVSENLSYLSTLVKDNNLGWTISPGAESLASKVISISLDEVRQKRSNLAIYIENNYWELDEIQYKEAFGHV